MSDKRLNTQLNLAFPTEERGEALRAAEEVPESLAANRPVESPGMGEQFMEAVCEWSNIQQAVRRVKRNHGSAGVDGMTVHQLPADLPPKKWTPGSLEKIGFHICRITGDRPLVHT